MPVYLYEIVNGQKPSQKFEIQQNFSDPPLTHHPISKEPVRRVVSVCQLSLKHTDRHEQQVLSDKNIANHGFTKFEKCDDKGNFVKVAGEGM